jgi:superfamily II DNA or RNA helicase
LKPYPSLPKARPRPYQEAAIGAVLKAHERGLQRVLVTMPTGTGKTNVFCWLIERMTRDRPALVLAHRDELIRQAADRIKALAPGLRVGIEKAQEMAPPDSQVVVASVQTLGRKNSARLAWLEEQGPSLLICDEAHHAPAESYLGIFERFGAFRQGGAFLVGFTATPHRIDARSMGQVFEEEVYRYGLRTAMKEGWLCPICCFRVVTDTDLSSVGTVAGDFDTGELARAVNNQERTLQAIRHFDKVARDRRAIVFCVDVEHAHDTARLFREKGYRAEAVDGAMPLEDRRAVLQRLRSGETQVICNCAVLTEGFDCPEIGAVVMLRPTKSSAFYTQCVGRGTRPAPGKQDLVLLDVVDNCRRHSLVTGPVLLGMPTALDLEGNSLLSASELWDELGAGANGLEAVGDLTFTELETRLKEFDLFGDIELPAEFATLTALDWIPIPDGYLLTAGKGYEARLVTDALGAYRLIWSTDNVKRRSEPLGADLAAIVPRVDQHLSEQWQDRIPLISKDRGWMNHPATEKQKSLMLRRGYPPARVAKATKGEAKRIIAKMLS